MYLEEETQLHESPGGLLVLAHMWHDRCTGCDCEAVHCERGILPRVRALRRSLAGYLHVRRVP